MLDVTSKPIETNFLDLAIKNNCNAYYTKPEFFDDLKHIPRANEFHEIVVLYASKNYGLKCYATRNDNSIVLLASWNHKGQIAYKNL